MQDFNELVDALFIYAECLRNGSAASRVYAERYPGRPVPSRFFFGRLERKLRTTGSLKDCRRGRSMPGISSKEETQIAVLSAVAADPSQSIRDISRNSKITRHTVLKKNKFRPFHLHHHQALTESDHEKRLRFCHWAQQVVADDEHFFKRILWTDEATFCNDGTLNRHNMHHWSDANPHLVREVDKQHRWKVNVWCGIIGDRIIGPHIFDGTVNAAYFGQFLDTALPGLLEDLPLETRHSM